MMARETKKDIDGKPPTLFIAGAFIFGLVFFSYQLGLAFGEMAGHLLKE